MITQDDRHEYCSICSNRVFDKSKGILCGLTNKKADFINECTRFETSEKIDRIDLKNKSWEERKKRSEKNGRLSHHHDSVAIVAHDSNFPIEFVSKKACV